MADRTIEVMLKMITSQYTSGARQAAQATAQLGQAQQNTATQTAQLSGNTFDLIGGLKQAATAYGALKVAQQAIAWARHGAAIEATRKHFEALVGSQAEAADLLREIRTQTRGTVDDFTAMTSASMIMRLGLTDTNAETAEMIRLAQGLGRETLSAEEKVTRFTMMLATRNTRALDDFGISITAVRERVEELTRAGMDSAEAFNVATIEEARKGFEDLGDSIVNLTTPWEQFDAHVANATNSLQTLVAQGLTPAVTGLNAMLDIVTGTYAERFEQATLSSLQAADGLEEFDAATRRAVEAMQTDQAFLLGIRNYDQLATNVRQTAQSYEEYAAGMEHVNRAIREHNQQFSADFPGRLAEFQPSEEAWERISQTRRIQAARDADAAADAERERAQARADALSQAGQAIVDVEERINERRRAALERYAAQSVAIERQRGRDAQLAALRAGWDAADSQERTTQRRAEILETFRRAQVQAEARYQSAIANAARQHARQQEQIERQYQNRLADIRRQYEKDEFDATLDRDAAALFRARRRRDEEVAQAERQRDEQQEVAGQQYQDAVAQAARARQEMLAQAEASRVESIRVLEQSLRDEAQMRQRAADRARQEQRLRDRWALEDRQRAIMEQLRLAQRGYTEELNLARAYYRQLQLMQARSPLAQRAGGALARLIPQPTGVPEFASGGYAGGGLAMLHAGEFVLNPQTTKRLEGMVGGNLTQNNVTRGGVTVQATFNGMGQQDQGWMEAKLNDFARQLAEMLN